MDPDPDPRKEIEVDPDPDLDPGRGLKWIRIRPNAVDPGGSGSETLQIIFSYKPVVTRHFQYFIVHEYQNPQFRPLS